MQINNHRNLIAEHLGYIIVIWSVINVDLQIPYLHYISFEPQLEDLSPNGFAVRLVLDAKANQVVVIEPK